MIQGNFLISVQSYLNLIKSCLINILKTVYRNLASHSWLLSFWVRGMKIKPQWNLWEMKKKQWTLTLTWNRAVVMGTCPVFSQKMLRNCWNTYIYTSTEPWRKGLLNIYLRLYAYQLTRMILTIVIVFETRNEWSVSFLNARTASKFFDANKICEASARVIFISQSEPRYSLTKVCVLTLRVFGSFTKVVEQKASIFLLYC